MSSNQIQSLGAKTNPAQHAIRRNQKRTACKDGGGKTLKRRTRFATVSCRTHGKLPSGSGYTIPELRCAIPKTKAQHYGGCHKCKETQGK